jgi:hypothetical protein
MNFDSNNGSREIVTTHALYQFVARSEDGRRFEVVHRDRAIPWFYHDVPEDTARWAADHLTAQWIRPAFLEDIHAPNFWTSPPPRSYIICTDDRSLPRAFTERQAVRLGVEPMCFESSHSPFLSKPSQFADALLASLDRPMVDLPNPQRV